MKPYSYIRLEPADNGYTLSWEERTKRPGAGTYDECTYTQHNLVFADEKADEAFAKLKELHVANKAASPVAQKITVEVKTT